MSVKKQQLESISWPFYIDHVEDYVCIDNFLNNEEVAEVIKHSRKYKLQSSTLVNDISVKEIRDSSSVFIAPQGIEWLFRKLSLACHELNDKYFRFDIFGFIEGLQFTEYVAPSQHYNFHIDKLRNNRVRKLSVILQLTDEHDYEGGNLELHLGNDNNLFKAHRNKGALIMFPSYILHRVTPVTQGKRNSLVGWITGKPFT